MNRPNSMTGKPDPWSVPIPVAQLPEGGLHRDIEAGRRERDAMAEVAGLREILSADASLPFTGSSGASSPASTVLPKRCDFLPSIPPRFVAFAWRYLGCTRSFRSLADECPAKARSWLARCLQPGIPLRRRQDLASSWRISIVHSHMFSRRRRDGCTRPLQRSHVAPGM